MSEPRSRYVMFYVETPPDCTDDDEQLERRLRSSRILVHGWEDFGFRGEVTEVSHTPELPDA